MQIDTSAIPTPDLKVEAAISAIERMGFRYADGRVYTNGWWDSKRFVRFSGTSPAKSGFDTAEIWGLPKSALKVIALMEAAQDRPITAEFKGDVPLVGADFYG